MCRVEWQARFLEGGAAVRPPRYSTKGVAKSTMRYTWRQMPTALRSGPYRFYFYSYDCKEPKHMHIDRDNLSTKYWLDPLALAENRGYTRKELREIEEIIKENVEALKNAWDTFCNNA